MSKLFETTNLNIDESKKNILFIDHDDWLEKYNHVSGLNVPVIEALKDKFNILYFSFSKKKIDNLIYFNSKHYEILNKNILKRIRIDLNCDVPAFNKEIMRTEFLKVFENSNMPNIHFIFHSTSSANSVLPLGKYKFLEKPELINKMNSFHDYIGEDEELIEFIKNKNKILMNDLYEHVSPIAFSQMRTYMFMKFVEHCYNFNKEHFISFDNIIIDPDNYYVFTEALQIPFRNFYFENDNRGTRNFQKFPIAELQHLIYDEKFYGTPTVTNIKTKNFIFTGTIFHDKGNRISSWTKFLEKFEYEDSSFYIPLKMNGVSKQNSHKILEKQKKRVKEKHENLYNSIQKHPNYIGQCLPGELYFLLDEYKYSLILSCVSLEDSLNFRPILYAKKRILPFLDPLYDPTYLQIPKPLQDVLRVSNSKDIEQKIAYYNTNDVELQKLLDELENLFSIQTFKNTYIKKIHNYYEN